MPRGGRGGLGTAAHCTGASRSGAVADRRRPRPARSASARSRRGASREARIPPRPARRRATAARRPAPTGRTARRRLRGVGAALGGAQPRGRRGRRRRSRGPAPASGRLVVAAHAASSATWISVTGSVESAPKPQRRRRAAGHDQLRGEGGDHRAVVGAQRQRRDPQRDARGIRSLDRDVAQAPVRDDSAAEQQARHAVVGAGGEGLRHEHVDDRLAEACRDIGDRHRFAERLALLGPAGDRGLQSREREVVAVLRHVGRARQPARERDRASGRPERAARSISGPPG